LETILVRDTIRDIWEAMCRKYQGSTKVKRADQLHSLRREFEILEMGEMEYVNDYFARILAIANRIKHMEKDLSKAKWLKTSCDPCHQSLTMLCARLKNQTMSLPSQLMNYKAVCLFMKEE
jgi:hypothetical protein